MSEIRLAAAIFISLFIILLYSYFCNVSLQSFMKVESAKTTYIMSLSFATYSGLFQHYEKRIKALENKGKIFSSYGDAL